MRELLTKAVYSDAENERERKNRQVAYRAATEGIVLLENDGTLPIKTGKVALYGAGATRTIKGGTGSGEVNERHSVTIEEGLKNAGFEVTTQKWLTDYESDFIRLKEEYKKVVLKQLMKLDFINAMANPFHYPDGRDITDSDIKDSNTDTCIYVVSRQAGEGADRKLNNGDNNLTAQEIKNLKTCLKAYAKTILVINVGCSLDMSFLEELPGLSAVIYLSQLGTQGGNAFADIITGKVTPSGRLTDTWAKSYSDIVYGNEFSYLNGNTTEEYYKEGIYVGYRYFDTFSVAPKYEFGFGLSYTQFDIKTLSVEVDKTKIQTKVNVTNTGNQYTAKEVVQLYVSCPDGTLEKEYQSLAAFAKTKELKPGESQELVLIFDMADLASYDESTASYLLDAGNYIVRIGQSSRTTEVAALVALDASVVVSKHEHICKSASKITELHKSNSNATEEVPVDTILLKVNASDFETKVYTYEQPAVYHDEKVDKFLKTFSVQDMLDVIVGAGMMPKDLGLNVPGSVGNTTSKFFEKGLINATLSDGPAGLRLQKMSGINKKGVVKPLTMPIEFAEAFPEFMKKFMIGDKDKDTLIYQFTTAFPVELALAQTWNTEILYEMGKAVSEEMSEYGVTYWLAPALNIHRNPLCGRNFEYYSEDPFLTGKLAAAVISGVQGTEGNYVTIKHFACNNQEDNRNKVSSNLDERPLREIYLKAFGMAVKEGNAAAVMTSYNRINGTYSPNSYDLCTKALRNEWGFHGVVMTDWLSTNKGLGSNGLAMKAGNDLIMPGGKYYKKEIMKSLQSGEISEEDLQRCCANILKQILESKIQKDFIKHK